MMNLDNGSAATGSETVSLLMNYTPHDVNFIKRDGSSVVLPSLGVARVSVTSEHVGDLGEFPVCRNRYGTLEGLPEEQEGYVYIVSTLAAQAAKEAGRKDCVIVNDAVRNEKGQVIGCRSFAVL